ncbi:MAG: hypothetical protein C0432_01005 [Candidatus Puniceispirillum sp.]|nr:hypothetical protein [Candidatus Pelagibacter sp.]MBA4282861.1 hypothetical protein [Candidatus Puniceispirillum sp.]
MFQKPITYFLFTILILPTNNIFAQNKICNHLEPSKQDFMRTLLNKTVHEVGDFSVKSPIFGSIPHFFVPTIPLTVPYIGQYDSYENMGNIAINLTNPQNPTDNKFIVIQKLSWSNFGKKSPWSIKTHAWLYPESNHKTNSTTQVNVRYLLTNSIASESRPSVHIHPLSGGGADTIMFSPDNFHLAGLPLGDIDKDSFVIFQSQIIHDSKSANTLHILMNPSSDSIYDSVLASENALQALDALISSSSLSTDDRDNFGKIVQFLNSEVPAAEPMKGNPLRVVEQTQIEQAAQEQSITSQLEQLIISSTDVDSTPTHHTEITEDKVKEILMKLGCNVRTIQDKTLFSRLAREKAQIITDQEMQKDLLATILKNGGLRTPQAGIISYLTQ